MGNAESSTSPSPCEGADDAVDENEDVEIIDIEPKLLFCTSISLSAEEMQCLNLEENQTNDECPTTGEIEEEEENHPTTESVEEEHNRPMTTTLETIEEEDEEEDGESVEESGKTDDKQLVSAGPERMSTSKFGFFHTVLTNADGKTYSQWYGFFRKLKKGAPGMSFHTFHPSIPSLHSIRKLSKKRSRKNMMMTSPLDVDLVPHFFETSWKNFSLSELQKATDNFNIEHLIGEGGYSEVYKGHLEDGRLVAVKRLIRGSPEEMTADYLSELGILVHVNHPNIANVIGYGVDGGMYLVLPLSPQGSLATLLNGDQKENLTWCFRYNIALGTASGLAYLHEECHRRIIHRDIKAANVLLSQDFEPLISDFGLAKWLPDKWSHLTVSQFEGTFGYLPPEFFMHGIVDEKTDVYAYGVLLLEIITGRPALDQFNNSVVMWAKPLLLKKNFGELADPSLGGSYDLDQMNRMAMVASLCLQQSAVDRPQMSKIGRMLKGEEGISQDSKRFQNRPSFNTYTMDLLNEELLDTPKSSIDSPKSASDMNEMKSSVDSPGSSSDTPKTASDMTETKSSIDSPESSNDTPKTASDMNEMERSFDTPKSSSDSPKSASDMNGMKENKINEITLEQ